MSELNRKWGVQSEESSRELFETTLGTALAIGSMLQASRSTDLATKVVESLATVYQLELDDIRREASRRKEIEDSPEGRAIYFLFEAYPDYDWSSIDPKDAVKLVMRLPDIINESMGNDNETADEMDKNFEFANRWIKGLSNSEIVELIRVNQTSISSIRSKLQKILITNLTLEKLLENIEPKGIHK